MQQLGRPVNPCEVGSAIRCRKHSIRFGEVVCNDGGNLGGRARVAGIYLRQLQPRSKRNALRIHNRALQRVAIAASENARL